MIRRYWGVILLWALLTGFTFPDAAGLTINEAGVYEYRGLSVRMDQKDGYRPIPEEWVRHALAEHQYPYDLEALLGKEFPIYLTDRQIVSSGGRAVAVTISGEVILFSGSDNPDRALVEETVLHEVAHALAARTMTDELWSKFRTVRRLGPEYRMNAPYWHRLPTEVFAEDFAHLFGTEEARKAEWKLADLPLPGEVPGLRSFFLELVGPGAPLAKGRVPVGELATELSRLPGVSARLAELPWRQDGPLTRAQAAYLLSLALNGDPGEGDVFRSDLAEWPSWATAAIEQVQRHRLLVAKPDGRFAPDDFLDEQEAMQALNRLRSYAAAIISRTGASGRPHAE